MGGIACAAATRDLLGEVPVWCWRSRRLWWVDVLTPRLHSLDPETGRLRSYAIPFRRLGSIALRDRGGLVLATERGIHAFDPESGAIEFLVDPEPGRPNRRLNDGRCDRAGRFWVGSMNDEAFVPEGRFFRVDPDLRVATILENIIIPNSVAFSPDDRTLYFADTRRFTIWAFSFDISEGTIGDRRVFAEVHEGEARPDGSCIDQEGYLWNAEYAGGRVVRYAPTGEIDRIVSLPVTYPTCCCFGGTDLGTLFVTSARFPLSHLQASREPLAGALLTIETGFRGLPEPLFRG